MEKEAQNPSVSLYKETNTKIPVNVLQTTDAERNISELETRGQGKVGKHGKPATRTRSWKTPVSLLQNAQEDGKHR